MKKVHSCKISYNTSIYNEVISLMYYLLFDHTTRQDTRISPPGREKKSEYRNSQKSKIGGAKICNCAIRHFCNWRFLQLGLIAINKLKIFVSNQITLC